MELGRHRGLQPKQERDVDGDEEVGPGGASAAHWLQCCSQMCVKKDENAFMGFFDKHIYLPLPRYASCLVRLVSCFYSCLCVCGCCT